jgi:hypothetical protein
VKNHWAEIISIWVVVAIVTSVLVLNTATNDHVEVAFGAILAGSVALVSMIQLFRAQPEGFVRRLVYVGGGSYLILAIATAFIFWRG